MRIHVNGTRGKSSVTRLVAAVLRESGRRTLAKTTGSAAVVVDPVGADHPLFRAGAPTILEQIDFVRRAAAERADALVVECMAIRPAYQAVSEDRIIRSTLGILTNVREDHQDLLGRTRAEIAGALLRTCPRGGVLLTAEHDPAILALVREEAGRRGSRVVVVDPSGVRPEDLARFDHVAHPDNVALALGVADLLRVSREAALRAMTRAAADPGVMSVRCCRIDGREVTFVNLFAANDPESVIATVRPLLAEVGPDTTTVALLNNRRDREQRVLQFADVAARDLRFDRIATLGAYQRAVARRLLQHGVPAERIVPLGTRGTADALLDALVRRMPTRRVRIVGMVNLHTPQARTLLDALERHGLAREP